MPLLHLSTKINAPIQTVFDLARNIDFHQKSASQTGEKAIAGRTSGLIELGETVTWEAVHFGIKQQLTTQITAMNAPHSFRDEMLYGAFKSIRHEHFFYLDSARYDKNESNALFNSDQYDKNESNALFDSDRYDKNESSSTLSNENTSNRESKSADVAATTTQHKQQQCATIMVDLFHFESPLALLGKVANVLILKRYMFHFLHIRNQAIKSEAERINPIKTV